jgi:hypothetical protein
MKTHMAMWILRSITVTCFLLIACIAALGQGTLTFNGNPWWSGTDYTEQGVGFHVVLPGGGSSYDNMGIAPNGVGGTYSQDGTAFMVFHQQLNPSDYVSFSLTDSSLFDLTSIQLADPDSPSASAVSISFIGYLPGGSTVTESFMTPGNGATTFANYSFNSDFTGLTKVDVLGQKWAMDNLTFTVPEPSPAILTVFGLGFAFFYRKWRGKARS